MRLASLTGGAADGGVRLRAAWRLEACARALLAAGENPAAETIVHDVPGRVEVLGKHTDYLGGRSLLAAVDRGFCLAAVAREDGLLVVTDAAGGEVERLDLDDLRAPRRGHWSNYAHTVARRLVRDFPGRWGGASVAFASDLPAASGLSSSSALITGLVLTLVAVQGLDHRPEFRSLIDGPEELAQYAAAVESGAGFRSLAGEAGVGTHGGSEDHTAILCAVPGNLVCYRFAPLLREATVPLPAHLRFVVAFSGVHAEKTGAALALYNRTAALGRALQQAWRVDSGRDDATLAEALRSHPEAPARLRALAAADAAGELLPRLEHFLAESEEIIPAAVEALAVLDLERFGGIVDRSQQLGERLLRNQTPETVELARSAREIGAVAASAFGAGFGGSVWALVPLADAPRFLERWELAYRARFPHRSAAEFFVTHAAPPARRLS